MEARTIRHTYIVRSKKDAEWICQAFRLPIKPALSELLSLFWRPCLDACVRDGAAEAPDAATAGPDLDGILDRRQPDMRKDSSCEFRPSRHGTDICPRIQTGALGSRVEVEPSAGSRGPGRKAYIPGSIYDHREIRGSPDQVLRSPQCPCSSIKLSVHCSFC